MRSQALKNHFYLKKYKTKWKIKLNGLQRPNTRIAHKMGFIFSFSRYVCVLGCFSISRKYIHNISGSFIVKFFCFALVLVVFFLSFYVGFIAVLYEICPFFLFAKKLQQEIRYRLSFWEMVVIEKKPIE